MNSGHTLVSVITPVYNCDPRYLHELIQSVRDQDYPHIEHIVIDDGSSDGGATRRVLGEYSHVHWRSRENRGQYPTQNEALREARGQIVCVIAADDRMVVPSTVSRVVAEFQADPSVDIVYGGTKFIDSEGKNYWFQVKTRKINDWLFQRLPLLMIKYTNLTHCSLYVRKKLIYDHELWFDTNLLTVSDTDWLVRLFEKASSHKKIRGYLSEYRIHTDSTTRKSTKKKIYDQWKHLSAKHKSPYFLLVMLTWIQLLWRRTKLLLASVFNPRVPGPMKLFRQWRAQKRG